jgi:hypothetical protein
MKKLYSKLVGTITLTMLLLSSSQIFAQDSSLKTAIHLASGVTHPIGKNTTTSSANPQMITSCDGNDIRIFPSPNPQSEIHLSINKVNPNVLLLSSQTFPVANSYQGAYWSTDGGTTWVGSDNLPNNAPGRGDPSTAFDAAGNGYVSTMSYLLGDINNPPNGYWVQRTSNNGATWQAQVSGSGIIDGFDKEMIAADDIAASPNANNFYCTWTNFNVSGRIEFNSSTNNGATFSTPIYLSAGSGQGANVQTGTNGEVYVCWSDYAANGLHDYSAKGLGFCRSTNGGVSFTAGQRVLGYAGIRAYNAATDNDQNPLFNNIRVNDFPSMGIDKSMGAHRGRIYAVVPVKENGNGKAIIQISWSDNQGTSWSPLKTISIANGRQNWFPWISVDATNGNIYVIYYSLDAANGFSTNTYVAISNDAGATFINQIVSDAAHITAPIPEFSGGYSGDYIGITSFNGRAYAAWSDNRTGQWQDYVSQVSNSDISGSDYFCTSGNYSVTNLPANSTVSWTVSPTGIANLSCSTCNQTTLSKASMGTVTLNASITNACSTTPISLTKNISVGFAPVTLNSSQTGSCNGSYQTWSLSADPASHATNWNWTVSYLGSNSDIYIYQPYSSSTFADVKGGGTIKLAYTDVCGNNKTDGVTVYSNCYSSPSFTLSPNPAQNNVVVTADNKPLSKNKLQNLIYAVKISDELGTLRKSFEYKSGVASTNISLSGLNSGTYLISVFDGQIWSSRQFIVQK